MPDPTVPPRPPAGNPRPGGTPASEPPVLWLHGSPASRRRRRRRRVLWTLAVLAVLGTLVYTTRERFLLPQAARAVERFARGAGLELELASPSGNLFRSLAFERVTLRALDPGAPLAHLEAHGVDVALSLGRLLRGDVLVVRAIDVERVELRLRPGRPDGERDAAQSPGSGPDLGRTLPAVDVRRLDVAWDLGDGRSITVEDGSLSVGPPQLGTRQVLDARAAAVAWSAPGAGGSSAELEVGGEWDRGLVTLERLRYGALAPLQRGKADLGRLHRGLAHGELALALGGGRVEVEARTEAGSLRASAHLRSFDAARAAEELAPLGAAALARLVEQDRVPRGAWRLDATLDVDRAGAGHGPPRATARAIAGPVSWSGRAVERAELELELDGDRLEVRALDVADAVNHVALRDVTLDLAAEGITELFAASGGRVRIDLNDLPGLIAPDVRPAFALPEHRVSAVAALEEGRLRVLEGRFDTPGGELVLESGTVRLVVGPRPLSGAPPPLSLSYSASGAARFDSLEPLTAILAKGPFAGSLHGELALEGNGAAVDGRAELTGESVTAAGWALGDVDVALELDDGRLAVERLAARRGDEWLEAAGTVQLFTPGDAGAPLAFSGFQLRARLEESWDRIGAVALPSLPPAEAVEVDFALDGPWTALTGVVAARAASLRVGDETFEQVSIDLVAKPSANGVEVEVERAEAASAFGHLALLGTARYDHAARELEARLAELSIARGEQQLALEAPVVYRWENGAHALERASFSGTAGAFHVALEGPAGALSVAVGADELDLAPFAGRFLPSELELHGLDVEARVDLAGSRVSAASLRATLAHLRPAAGLPAATVDVAAEWSEDVLRLERLAVATDAGDRLDAHGSAPLSLGTRPFADGALELAIDAAVGDLSQWLPGPITHGSASADLALAGAWRDLTGTVQLAAGDVAFEAEGSKMAPLGRVDGRMALRLDGAGRVTVDAIAVDAHAGARAEVAGSAAIANDLPAWLADPLAAYRAMTVDLAGDADVPELVWLQPLVPEVRTLGGRARLDDLRLVGHPRRLERAGRLSVEHGLLKLDADVPAISEVMGTLVLERRALDELGGEEQEVLALEGINATLGGAPIDLDGWVAPFGTVPHLALHLVGEGVLLYRTPDAMVRADAELWLDGPLDALRLTGVLEPTAARFTRDVNFLNLGRGRRTPSRGGRGIELFSFRGEPLASMTFDVRVRAREPFRIDNNFAKGSLLPDLTLRGTGEVPVLEGPIYLQPTSVALPATRLRFTGGTIVFEREDPFVPQINLRGETRMRGYDIDVQLIGPYDDPEIVMSSVPPLPPQDVAVLVATGQLPESAMTAEGGVQTARLVAVYLAQDFSGQFFGDDTGDEESFFERFEVSTGRDVSRTGQETIEGSFRVFEDEGIADRGLITIERDVHDDYNFGIRFVWRFR